MRKFYLGSCRSKKEFALSIVGQYLQNNKKRFLVDDSQVYAWFTNSSDYYDFWKQIGISPDLKYTVEAWLTMDILRNE